MRRWWVVAALLLLLSLLVGGGLVWRSRRPHALRGTYASVRACATASILLTPLAHHPDPQAFDGVLVHPGDRVLLRCQAQPQTQGLYLVPAVDQPWVRAPDLRQPHQIIVGQTVWVREGHQWGQQVLMVQALAARQSSSWPYILHWQPLRTWLWGEPTSAQQRLHSDPQAPLGIRWEEPLAPVVHPSVPLAASALDEWVVPARSSGFRTHMWQCDQREPQPRSFTLLLEGAVHCGVGHMEFLASAERTALVASSRWGWHDAEVTWHILTPQGDQRWWEKSTDGGGFLLRLDNATDRELRVRLYPGLGS